MKKFFLALVAFAAFTETQIQASATFIDMAGPLYITNLSLSNNTTLNNTSTIAIFNLTDSVLLSLKPLTHEENTYYYTQRRGKIYTLTTVFGAEGAYLRVTFPSAGSIAVDEYDTHNFNVSNYTLSYTGSTPPLLYIKPSTTVSGLKITLPDTALVTTGKISLILNNLTGKEFTLHQHSYATGSLNTDVLPVNGSILNLTIGEQYFLLLSDGSKIFIRPTASNSIDSYVLSSAVFNAGTTTQAYNYSTLTIVPDSISTYALQAK